MFVSIKLNELYCVYVSMQVIGNKFEEKISVKLNASVNPVCVYRNEHNERLLRRPSFHWTKSRRKKVGCTGEKDKKLQKSRQTPAIIHRKKLMVLN